MSFALMMALDAHLSDQKFVELDHELEGHHLKTEIKPT